MEKNNSVQFGINSDSNHSDGGLVFVEPETKQSKRAHGIFLWHEMVFLFNNLVFSTASKEIDLLLLQYNERSSTNSAMAAVQSKNYHHKRVERAK